MLFSCANHAPEKTFDAQQLATFTNNMLPYLHKKPDHVGFNDRTLPAHARHYEEIQMASQGVFSALKKEGDTLYFNFTYKDRSSLYEHYQAFGGKTVLDANLKPVYVNLLYHTPRLGPEQKETVPAELFGYMASHGNINAYIGQREFVKTPNEDFEYNVAEKHWQMTENSTWKILEEMKYTTQTTMK